MGLSDILLNENNRETFVDDCVKLIDKQVAAAPGLGGLALKAAYSTVKGIRADYCAQVVDQLLPEISIALDPMWTEAVNNGNPVEYLAQRKAIVADELLQSATKGPRRAQERLLKAPMPNSAPQLRLTWKREYRI